MDLLRSGWSTRCAVLFLGFVLVRPAEARAQMFGELAGGSNVLQPVPSGVIYASGSSLRASIGWKVASNFSWRVDAFTSQFDSKDTDPCPGFGCSSGTSQTERVNGLTGNALLGVDSRGIVYVVGGAGLYQVNEVDGPTTGWHFGVSAGAGLAVPVAPHVRAVLEARWRGLFGATAGPSWLVPVTLGLRVF